MNQIFILKISPYKPFAYSDLKLEYTDLPAGEDLELSVTVKNTGERDGTEVAQVYLSDTESSVRTPIAQLVDFQRADIAAGEEARLHFRIPAKWMQVTFEDGTRHFEAGEFSVFVGGSSPGERSVALGAAEGVTGSFLLNRD